MRRKRFAVLLGTLLAIAGSSGVWAQDSTNNPNNAGGVTGSKIANPERPTPTNANPALATQTAPASATNLPPDKNPNVKGATGHTKVLGSNSTLSGDKPQTVQQKTGSGVLK